MLKKLPDHLNHFRNPAVTFFSFLYLLSFHVSLPKGTLVVSKLFLSISALLANIDYTYGFTDLRISVLHQSNSNFDYSEMTFFHLNYPI